MDIKTTILKQKGKWLLTLKNNYKMVVDLDNDEWDSYEWYDYNGSLEQNINKEMFNSLFKDIKEIKKI